MLAVLGKGPKVVESSSKRGLTCAAFVSHAHLRFEPAITGTRRLDLRAVTYREIKRLFAFLPVISLVCQCWSGTIYRMAIYTSCEL